jgi:xylulokinase
MEVLLGIDIGTSACKVAAFNAATGLVLATSTQGYPVYHPQPGFVEQDPNEWWQAVCTGVRDVLSQGVSASEIAGIGIDGQSWSAIPIDADGRVLHRTPIWMDTRAAALAATVESRLGADRLFKISGNPFSPSYVTPKVLYWLENQPELMARTDKILGSNAWIGYQLTGQVSQDYSQGYGWHCFDEATLQYDWDLLRDLGIPARLLPDLVPSHAVIGRVTTAAAAATGLLPGTPVVAGALDATCGTLGAGVVSAGQTQEQGGQAGGMSICIDRPLSHPQLILSPHVVPGHWLLQGGTVGGGGTMGWFARELGAEEEAQGRENGTNPFQIMDREADEAPLGSQGLICLPYMSGERSPLWDPKAQGVFFGLSYDKHRGDMIRSILEGTAFALAHNIETARSAGAVITEIRAMGGAANSRVWTQIKTDVLGFPILVPSADTATTLGAALVAGVGVGTYRDYQQAVAQTIRINRSHQPDLARHDLYRPYYDLYKSLYPQLKESMHRLADLKGVH